MALLGRRPTADPVLSSPPDVGRAYAPIGAPSGEHTQPSFCAVRSSLLTEFGRGAGPPHLAGCRTVELRVARGIPRARSGGHALSRMAKARKNPPSNSPMGGCTAGTVRCRRITRWSVRPRRLVASAR
jgi:hypothetical protein